MSTQEKWSEFHEYKFGNIRIKDQIKGVEPSIDELALRAQACEEADE